MMSSSRSASCPSTTEEKLKLVASLSPSSSSLHNNAMPNSADEDSEGMSTAATPITTNVSSNKATNNAANEDDRVQQDKDESGSVRDSERDVVLEDSESEQGDREQDGEDIADEGEQVQVDHEESSDLQHSSATPTTTNASSSPNADNADNATAATTVTYAFPMLTEEEGYEKLDSDINSHQTSALDGIDIVMDSSVATITTDYDGDSIKYIPCSILLTPTSTPNSNHYRHQVQVDMAAMEPSPTLDSPWDNKNEGGRELVKKKEDNGGTPDTSNATTAPSDSDSYTDDPASSSSNFSSTSEEDESHCSVTYLEDFFEQQDSVADGIVQLFLMQQQNSKRGVEGDIRQRKLLRRKQVKLARYLQTCYSEDDNDDESETRRRTPPSRRHRHPRDYSGRQHRQKDRIQKTLHYNAATSLPRRTQTPQPPRQQTPQDRGGENVVKENRRARPKPLNDDYMLQEEIWLNMFCNAVPSFVLDYFKVFGCVKVVSPKDKEEKQHQPYPQPFVTDEEYRQQQYNRRSHFWTRMQEQQQDQVSSKQQVPSSVTFDESERSAHNSVSTNDKRNSVQQEHQVQKPHENFWEGLELEEHTGGGGDLSTILEENGDEMSELTGQNLAVAVNYPPNQPPTFAC